MAQQNKTKVVPDSLCCITPQQVIRHIEDVYTIRGMNTSLLLEEKIVIDLNQAIVNLKAESSEKDKEIKLHLLQTSNCKEDNKHITSLNVKANRRITMQKVVIYILGGLTITELGYIDVLKINR